MSSSTASSPLRRDSESKAYGYAEARQTLQWLISARVMFRQAENEQPKPNPVKFAAFDQEIDRLINIWTTLDPNGSDFSRIEQEFEPEVKQIFALLEASDSTE